MRALDLFCGAGGAAMGLSRAGFEIIGVDIEEQPRFPFEFIRADACSYPLDGFDLIWASPPCQRYSMYSRNTGTSDRHPDLVATIRERLRSQRSPWIIENVVGAPLRDPTMLCGTMFGLRLLRHRLFETSFAISSLLPSCAHLGDEIPVYGHGTPQWHRERCGNIGIAAKREAMGIDWMNRDELSNAIPPVYSQWVASQAPVRRSEVA